MKIKTPLVFVFAWLAALAFVPSASAGLFGGSKERTHSVPVPMGDNTFSITRQAKTGFDRDVDRLTAEAREDAERYCAEHGKQLKVITQADEKPFFSLGYASVKIVFKALDANAPELTAASAPASGAIPPSSATYTQSGGSAPAYAPANNGGFDLYTELNKLDDLRKRGLLTDKEFQQEKKKLLKHSR